MLRCVGRFWHLADNRGTATICPLLDKSGQRSAQALNAPVVNDPISDTGWGAIGSAATGVIRAELLVLNRRHDCALKKTS
jgi:hypothetical protein